MLSSPAVSSVLFACSENAVRSPMAEALMKRHVGYSIFVDSVGVRKSELNGFAFSVMQEWDIDLSQFRSKTFQDLLDHYIDLIITLSPEAHHHALELTRNIACQVEFWPTFDPTSIIGPREVQLQAFRDVRDQLWQKIITKFPL